MGLQGFKDAQIRQKVEAAIHQVCGDPHQNWWCDPATYTNANLTEVANHPNLFCSSAYKDSGKGLCDILKDGDGGDQASAVDDIIQRWAGVSLYIQGLRIGTRIEAFGQAFKSYAVQMADKNYKADPSQKMKYLKMMEASRLEIEAILNGLDAPFGEASDAADSMTQQFREANRPTGGSTGCLFPPFASLFRSVRTTAPDEGVSFEQLPAIVRKGLDRQKEPFDVLLRGEIPVPAEVKKPAP
ncbi:MAG: hypothetical protein HYS22_05610 [Deltaproteobacteria bacterium]|nr:hypothetical protein [Deltaproteobacteria bacterium]